MKTLLLNLPSNYFIQPTGISRLYNYLKKRDYEVEMFNENYEFFRNIFSEHWMKQLVELSYRCKRAKAWDGIPAGSFIQRVAGANKILDSHFTRLSRKEFYLNLEILRNATRFISYLYSPTQLDLFKGISMKYSPHCSKEIIHAAADVSCNFLIHYYESHLYPRIIRSSPDMVGISIEHSSEIIPAFTLMKIIKERSDTPIIIGGPIVTLWHDHINRAKRIHKYFDYIAVGPGEIVIPPLLRALESGTEAENAVNLLYRSNESVVASCKRQEFDINEASAPLYREPRPGAVIGLETSQHCYWGNCAFCNWSLMKGLQPYSQGNCYQQRRPDLVDSDFEYISSNYDPVYIRFNNTVMAPDDIEIISRINRKYGFRLFTHIRADKIYESMDVCRRVADAGFIGVAFGVESASERINKLYRKGVSPDTVKKITANFSKLGIDIRMYGIVNFPDETESEMMDSYSFFREMKSKFGSSLYISEFRIHKQVPVWENCRQFGIKKILRRRSGSEKYLYRTSWKDRFMMLRNYPGLHIRGREDLPYSYTYKSTQARAVQKRKKRLAFRIISELNPSNIFERNFFQLLDKARNDVYLR